VKFQILQRKKDLYFLARSIELKLQNWQFHNNEKFEVFDVISNAIKRCENTPEITRLHFVVELDPTRKSVVQQILETYVSKEGGDLCMI
jgi:hypothetical protein